MILDFMPFEDSLDLSAKFAKIMYISRHTEDQILYLYFLFKIIDQDSGELLIFRNTIAEIAQKCSEYDDYLKIVESPIINPYKLWSKKVIADIKFYKQKFEESQWKDSQIVEAMTKKSLLAYLQAINELEPYAAKILANYIAKSNDLCEFHDITLYFLNTNSRKNSNEPKFYSDERVKQIMYVLYNPEIIEKDDYLMENELAI